MRTWLILSACIVIAALYLILTRLHPPGGLTIAAGPAGGAYAGIAERYAQILAQDGIDLKIIETEGSVENAALLEQGQVDASFLQGGIALADGTAEAIGSVFFEPMVFLARGDTAVPSNPALWRGLRINSGQLGSGTEAAFRDFEQAIGVSRDDNIHLEIPYDKAVAALLAGELDIAVFVAPIDAPYLAEAYDVEGLQVLVLDHVQAISRRLEYANVVRVPAGGMSMHPVLPPSQRELIALEARLVVRPDLHPALVNRLTMAAISLHRNRGIITDPGEFPSIEGTGLPVNKTARQLIQVGPSTWHDWLPYWIAAQINRVLLLFLPFVFIVVPLLRLFPLAYAYLMRWRVWQHYPEIRQIEDELTAGPDPEQLKAMQGRLAELDDRLAALRLPAAYRQGQYDARLHLELVQKRISELERQNGQGAVSTGL